MKLNKVIILIFLSLTCTLVIAGEEGATDKKLAAKNLIETKEKFLFLIINKIKRNYTDPDINISSNCIIRFELSIKGEVSNIDTSDCVVKELAESAVFAIKKSTPLPVSKDPEVFEVLKNVTVKFAKE